MKKKEVGKGRKLFNRPDTLLVEESALPGVPAPPPFRFDGLPGDPALNESTRPDLPPVRGEDPDLIEADPDDLLEAGEADDDDAENAMSFSVAPAVRVAPVVARPVIGAMRVGVAQQKREGEEFVVPADLVEQMRDGAALDLSDDSPADADAAAAWEDESDARGLSDPSGISNAAAVRVVGAPTPVPGTTLLAARTLPPSEAQEAKAEVVVVVQDEENRVTERQRPGRIETAPTQVMESLPASGFPALAPAPAVSPETTVRVVAADSPAAAGVSIAKATKPVGSEPRAKSPPVPRPATPVEAKPVPVERARPPETKPAPVPPRPMPAPAATRPVVAKVPEPVRAPEPSRGVVPLKDARGGSSGLSWATIAAVFLLVVAGGVAFLSWPWGGEEVPAVVATRVAAVPAAPGTTAATPPAAAPGVPDATASAPDVAVPSAAKTVPAPTTPTTPKSTAPPAAVPVATPVAAVPAPTATTRKTTRTAVAAPAATPEATPEATMASSAAPIPSTAATREPVVEKGLIQILSDENCLIIIDGKQRGYTPNLGPIELSAGMHVVRGVVPGKGYSRTVEVRVDAGLLRQVELRFAN